MKALTLTQPWATLVAVGAKTIETRGWNTAYRGLVAIHAAKKFPADCRALCPLPPFYEALDVEILHTGKVLAVAELATVFRFDGNTLSAIGARSRKGALPPHEADFGDYEPGRYGFVLKNVVRLGAPVEARGMLSLWELPPNVAREVEAQLTAARAGV